MMDVRRSWFVTGMHSTRTGSGRGMDLSRGWSERVDPYVAALT